MLKGGGLGLEDARYHGRCEISLIEGDVLEECCILIQEHPIGSPKLSFCLGTQRERPEDETQIPDRRRKKL